MSDSDIGCSNSQLEESDDDDIWLMKSKSRKRKLSHDIFSDDDDEDECTNDDIKVIKCCYDDDDDDDNDDNDDDDDVNGSSGESASEDEDDDGDDDDDEEVIDENDGIVCPICMEDFTEQKVAVPENCLHLFCADCLQEWSKNMNTCPVDRKKFNSISILLNKDGTVLEEIYIEDCSLKLKEDEFVEPPTHCEVCGECDREDVLLLCDECDKGYHLDCLQPPLSSVPIEEWYCQGCEPQIEQRECSRIQERRARGANYEDDNDDTANNARNADDMLSILERQRGGNIRAQVRSLVYGQPTTRARTVASSRRGRGRGGRSRGRGGRSRGRRSTSRGRSRGGSRERSNSRGTSRGSKRRKRKTKKRRKKSKKAGNSSKSPSKTSLLALQKAKKKQIKEQLKRFREKLSSNDNSETTDQGLSLFGNHFNLDAFHGDPEELYTQQEQSPPRSTIVNTTDVVGSILGGYGTLNPDNVIVQRDGTLKEKQVIEEERKKDKHSALSKSVTDQNKKRRKIRFTTDENDDNDTNDLSKDDGAPNSANIESNNSSDMEIEQEAPTESDTDTEALKAIMHEKYLTKLKEQEEKKKFAEFCKKLREEKKSNKEKSIASLQNVSKFKIPKKQHNNDIMPPGIDNGLKASSSETSSNESTFKIPKSTKSPCKLNLAETSSSAKRNLSKVKQEKRRTYIKEDQNINLPTSSKTSVAVQLVSVTKKERLKLSIATGSERNEKEPSLKDIPAGNKIITLEKKMKLYAEGKLKPRGIRERKTDNLVKSSERGTNGIPIKHNFISPKYSILKKKGSADFAVKKLERKRVSNKDASETKCIPAKKSISINDYKKRQLFDEVFGDADLEQSLQNDKKKERSTRQVTFDENSFNTIAYSMTDMDNTKKSFNKSTEALMKKIDSKYSPRKYSIPPDEAKRLLLSPQRQISLDTNSSTDPVVRKANVIRKDFEKTDKKDTPSNANESKKVIKDIHKQKPNKPENQLHKPVAVVAPSPRHDFIENQSKNLTDKQDVLDSTKRNDNSNKNQVQISEVLPKETSQSSKVDVKEKQALLEELNETYNKKVKLKETSNQMVSKEDMILKIKSLLKPHYTKKKITKDQWKELVKRAVRKVSAHSDYYMRDGKIEKLINDYLLPYLKN